MKNFYLPEKVHLLSRAVSNAGGTTYVAGGCVRDHLLGIESKDIDLEIHNLTPEEVATIIQQFVPYKAVGKSFGVWKLLPTTSEELEVDVALPQQDGQPAPFIGTKGACIRRDLTINAMLWNVETQQLEDPFNGSIDLRQRVLRATDNKHFADDPLRVFRVAQFAGRLQCDVDPNLQTLCQSLTQDPTFSTLPKERVLIELEKGWLKSIEPNVATQWLVRLQAFQNYIPTLTKLSSEQWQRTHKRIAYAGAQRPNWSIGHSMGLFWALLTFELSAQDRTVIFDQFNIERFHSFPIRRAFDKLDTYVTHALNATSRIFQNLVGEHIRPAFIYDVAECVVLGQSNTVFENREQSDQRNLLTNPLPRIVTGKDLLQVGLRGAKLGSWMQRIRDEQLHERIHTKEEALSWVKENL